MSQVHHHLTRSRNSRRWPGGFCRARTASSCRQKSFGAGCNPWLRLHSKARGRLLASERRYTLLSPGAYKCGRCFDAAGLLRPACSCLGMRCSGLAQYHSTARQNPTFSSPACSPRQARCRSFIFTEAIQRRDITRNFYFQIPISRRTLPVTEQTLKAGPCTTRRRASTAHGAERPQKRSPSTILSERPDRPASAPESLARTARQRRRQPCPRV